MVNKPPKPTKAPKAGKNARKNAATNPVLTNFPEGSLIARSQEFVKENNAKPFRDLGIFILVVLLLFVWRLHAAIQGQRSTGITVWGFLVFGAVAIINAWSYLLVIIRATRGGKLGNLGTIGITIEDDDVIRYMSISGLFGTWAGVFYYGYRSPDPKFFSRLMFASVLNVFWVIVLVAFYL